MPGGSSIVFVVTSLLTLLAGVPAWAAWGSASSAQCVLEMTGDDGPIEDVRVPRPPLRFRRRAREVFRVPFDSDALTGFSTDATWEAGPGFESRAVVVDYRREPVGDIDMYYHRTTGTLRVDVEVEETFRRTGLYLYLVKLAVDAFPRTKSMPARMYYADSLNVRVVADAVFGDAHGFRFFVPSKMSTEVRKQLRRDLLARLLDSPCMKTRAALGFRQLTHVELYPARGGLAFQMRRGRALKADSVDLTVVVRGRRKAILSDGSLVDGQALELPGYVDSHPW